MHELLNENRYDVRTTMKDLMYPCSRLMFKCRWQNEIVDCKTLFKMTETYQGFCCGFNLHKSDP